MHVLPAECDCKLAKAANLPEKSQQGSAQITKVKVYSGSLSTTTAKVANSSNPNHQIPSTWKIEKTIIERGVTLTMIRYLNVFSVQR